MKPQGPAPSYLVCSILWWISTKFLQSQTSYIYRLQISNTINNIQSKLPLVHDPQVSTLGPHGPLVLGTLNHFSCWMSIRTIIPIRKYILYCSQLICINSLFYIHTLYMICLFSFILLFLICSCVFSIIWKWQYMFVLTVNCFDTNINNC